MFVKQVLIYITILVSEFFFFYKLLQENGLLKMFFDIMHFWKRF